MYDIIIIGMGISGITAAIYGKRKNLKVLLLDKSMPGGMLNNLEKVSNYPGFTNIKGSELALHLFNQVKALDIPYKLEEVVKIEKKANFLVKTKTNQYETKNIILATGKKPKLLGINSERDYFGRGLSTCAVCDGNFYKDLDVAVIGNNKLAIEESLYLSNIVKNLYFITNIDLDLTKLKNIKNIQIIKDEIKEINGENDKISAITLKSNKVLNVKGLFVYNGYIPNTDLLNEFKVNKEAGYILVNENYETNIPHLYAIGDVIKKDIYQLVTAAFDGLKVVDKINKETE